MPDELNLRHLLTNLGKLCELDAPHPKSVVAMSTVSETSCGRCRKLFLRLARIVAVEAGVDARGVRLYLMPDGHPPIVTLGTKREIGQTLTVLDHLVHVRLSTPIATLPGGEVLYHGLTVQIDTEPKLGGRRG